MAFMKVQGMSGVTGMTGTVGLAPSEAMMESKRNPYEPFDSYEEWVANFSSNTFQVLEDCTYHRMPKLTPVEQQLTKGTLKDLARANLEVDTEVAESAPEKILLYPERTLVTGADLYNTFKDLDGFPPPILVLVNGQRIRQLKVKSEKPLLIIEAPVSFNGREDDIIADMFLDILPTLPAEQLARLVARKDVTQKISNIIRQFLA